VQHIAEWSYESQICGSELRVKILCVVALLELERTRKKKKKKIKTRKRMAWLEDEAWALRLAWG